MNRKNPNIMQVGGQAVMEGVMMRAPGKVATAVRRSSGEIIVNVQIYRSLTEKFPKFNIPIFRGAILLIDMMILGLKTLQWSVDIALIDEKKKAGEPIMKGNGLMNRWQIISTIVVASVLGIALFFFLPLFLTTKIFSLEQTAFSFNMASGLIRISLFLIYLWGISKLEDVSRLFQYHGAEHKSIYAYEAGVEINVDNASRFSRFHPRCGTSFIVMTLVIAIVSFATLDSILIIFLHELTLAIRIMTHLPLLPIVGGIGYELIKYSAKYSDHFLIHFLIMPGLWLQRITTREPDPQQLEVGVVALKAALGLEYSGQPSISERLNVAISL